MMMKNVLVPFVLSFAWISFVRAEVEATSGSTVKTEVVVEEAVATDDATASTDKSLALVVVGKVDAALLAPVMEQMREILLCDVVHLDGDHADVSGTLENLIDALSGLVGNHQGVVALANLPGDATGHGSFVPAKKAALLNVHGLAGDGGQEQLLKRLMKEAVHAGGLLLGISPCPNSHCAMWRYKNDEGLDFKGSGFCPPCQRTLRTKLGEGG